MELESVEFLEKANPRETFGWHEFHAGGRSPFRSACRATIEDNGEHMGKGKSNSSRSSRVTFLFR